MLTEVFSLVAKRPEHEADYSFPSNFLFLAPQPSLGLNLPHKIRPNFLEASQQFSLLQGRVVSPTPNLYPGGPGLCIYIPQRQGGYPFWVLGLKIVLAPVVLSLFFSPFWIVNTR
jgi:hypothetical protein